MTEDTDSARRRPARPRHPGLAGRDRSRRGNAGARVCVLRTSPVYDRRSQPLRALRLLFKAGLGGPLGDGKPVRADDLDAATGSTPSCTSPRPTSSGSVQPVLRAGADQRGAHPGAGPPGAPAGVLPGARRSCSAPLPGRWPRAARLGQRLPRRAARQWFHLPRPGRQRRDQRGPGPLARPRSPPSPPPSRWRSRPAGPGDPLASRRRVPADDTSPRPPGRRRAG